MVHIQIDSLPDMLGPGIALLVVLAIAYQKPALRVYAAYSAVLLCAAAAAIHVGNWMYLVAFCIGGLTAFTDDAQEGQAAFRERRTPAYGGS